MSDRLDIQPSDCLLDEMLVHLKSFFAHACLFTLAVFKVIEYAKQFLVIILC